MAIGLEMRVLDGVNARSLVGFWVGILCMGPMHWIRGWELAYGIYSWDNALVMEDLRGDILGWVVDFFLGGPGEGKRNSRARLPRCFRRTTRVPNIPVHVIYYILRSGSFAAACLQDIVKGVLDPRLPWADTCAVQVSRTRRPSPRIEDGEGVVTPPRTPRSSGYDVYAHSVNWQGKGCRSVCRITINIA
jgi:hypothetical protein